MSKSKTKSKSGDTLVGEVISLNCKIAPFWGCGQIWLSPTKYHATVPDTLTEEELAILARSLEAGNIVKGKKYIPPVDQNPAVLDDLAKMLTNAGNPGDSTKLTTRIRQAIQVRGEGGYTAQELLRHLIRHEQSGRNRREWITWLERAVMLCEGPETAVPTPDHNTEGIRQD